MQFFGIIGFFAFKHGPNSLSQTMIDSPGGVQAGRDVIVNQEPTADFYKKYYVVEMIESKKDTDKWKFIKKNGETFLGLKLQYIPVVNTISVRSSGQLIMTPSKEDYYESGYYYTLLIEKEDKGTKTERLIIQAIKNEGILFEVKYLRKNQS